MSELLLNIDAFSISPYAMSAFVALEEKGVPYTLVHVGIHAGEGARDRPRGDGVDPLRPDAHS